MRHFGELFGGFCSEVFQLFGTADEVATALAEFAHGFGVCFVDVFDALFQFVHVADESAEFVVHASGGFGYLYGIAVLAVFIPHLAYHAEHRHEVGRGDYQHA